MHDHPDPPERDFATPDFLPVRDTYETIDPSDDIAQQAASGSVAAIVQVLNQQLAERGVRTRAIFEGGCLQLLCESVDRDALTRETLLDRVRALLEDIDPAKIRRARVNARLAREQQLLWLDDIRRQPKQLLWSESLRLRPSGGLRRWWKSIARRDRRTKPIVARSTPLSSRSSGLGRGIAIGLAIAVLAGLAYRQWGAGLAPGGPAAQQTPGSSDLQNSPDPLDSPDSPNSSGPASFYEPPAADSESNSSAAPQAEPEAAPEVSPDPFAAAVVLATQAANDGQTATTASEWLDLSARWQRAAELMEQLPTDDARYQTARDRAATYRQNSQIAQQQAR